MNCSSDFFFLFLFVDMVDYIKNLWILKWLDTSKTNNICSWWISFIYYGVWFAKVTKVVVSYSSWIFSSTVLSTSVYFFCTKFIQVYKNIF